MKILFGDHTGANISLAKFQSRSIVELTTCIFLIFLKFLLQTFTVALSFGVFAYEIVKRCE